MSSIATFSGMVSNGLKGGMKGQNRGISAHDARGTGEFGEGNETRHPSEEALMYAWSIGTTQVARDMKPSEHLEECPPEVYIG